MEPTNDEEATSKKTISIEINSKKKKKKKKKKSTPPPLPPNIDGRNSYPARREKQDTTTSSCSSSRVQETLIEDEIIVVQQITNLSLDTKLKDDYHQRRRRVLFHDVISSEADHVAKTRKASKPKKLKTIRVIKGGEERRDCNYNDNHQVESKCEEGIVDTITKSSLPIVNKEGGIRCDEKKVDDDCLCAAATTAGWKVKGRRSAGGSSSSLELKKVEEVKSWVDVGFEFDSEMLEAAESLLMLRYGRPPPASASNSMVMVEEEETLSRRSINRGKGLLCFDLNHPPPTTPEDEQQDL